VTITVPVSPAAASSPSDTPLGPIGIAINGVVFFNQYASARQGLTDEILSFDRYNGHPTGTSQYHYHIAYRADLVDGLVEEPPARRPRGRIPRLRHAGLQRHRADQPRRSTPDAQNVRFRYRVSSWKLRGRQSNPPALSKHTVPDDLYSKFPQVEHAHFYGFWDCFRLVKKQCDKE